MQIYLLASLGQNTRRAAAVFQGVLSLFSVWPSLGILCLHFVSCLALSTLLSVGKVCWCAAAQDGAADSPLRAEAESFPALHSQTQCDALPPARFFRDLSGGDVNHVSAPGRLPRGVGGKGQGKRCSLPRADEARVRETAVSSLLARRGRRWRR